MNLNTDYTFKLTLLGDGKVGKTCLRRTYMGFSFISNHIMTLGADFSTKEIAMDTGETVHLQIWDIAGQEMFRTIRKRFLGGTAATIVVYDITNKSSFNNLLIWLQDTWKVNPRKKIPILIMGNKIDLEEDKQVDPKEAYEFIDHLKSEYGSMIDYIDFIETSAKTGVNVEKGFRQLVEAVYTQSTG